MSFFFQIQLQIGDLCFQNSSVGPLRAPLSCSRTSHTGLQVRTGIASCQGRGSSVGKASWVQVPQKRCNWTYVSLIPGRGTDSWGKIWTTPSVGVWGKTPVHGLKWADWLVAKIIIDTIIREKKVLSGVIFCPSATKDDQKCLLFDFDFRVTRWIATSASRGLTAGSRSQVRRLWPSASRCWPRSGSQVDNQPFFFVVQAWYCFVLVWFNQ